MVNSVTLLDCTLRDGGYINDWNWGWESAREIIRLLSKAKVDVIEVGFLRDVESYSPGITVCNSIEELNRLLPEEDTAKCSFSAMAMRGSYDLSQLKDFTGTGIDIIRVTAHENDIVDGINFAAEVQKRGYKVSVNPINIMGYDDQSLLRILDQVNEVHPWQFSIVDTFGSMKRRDLDRIVSLVDHNLDREIKVAVHLHENMAQSFSLAQDFVDKHLDRPTAIDGSLLGMGRSPGNLPIELIADYLNEYCEKNYDIDFLLDAIQDHIFRLKGASKWGYNPAYFLSAKYNLHRNYAEYYLEKGELIARDINRILSCFNQSKAAVFDPSYAEQRYSEYVNNQIDDTQYVEKLGQELMGKNILILAPGKSIDDEYESIRKYIEDNKPVVIAINFLFSKYDTDYVFFGNNRRFSQAGKVPCKTITTSNVEGEADYYINRNSISGAFKQGNNTLVMLLSLLYRIGCRKAVIAGADGFNREGANYYKDYIVSSTIHERNYNIEVAKAINRTGMEIEYLTKSIYQETRTVEK